MASFLDKVKRQMTGSMSKAPAQPKREEIRKSRTTVESNRFDERVWKEARKSRPVGDFVTDLLDGDDHKGGTRKPFEMGPETVHDLFMSLYKADPQVKHKRLVAREAYPVRKIMEEILESPQLQDLQETTAGDALMSTIATSSMRSAIIDIITRVPPPPPPPGGAGKKGGGGQGGQQSQGGQPGDQSGDQEGQAGGQGEGQGDGEQEGQGDQDGQGGGGTPEWDPDAEDGNGDEQGGDQEFDPNAEEDQGEADWEKAYDDLLDKMGMDMDVAAALSDAQDEVEELDDLRRGVGLDDGTWQMMSAPERLKIADRLRSPEMRAMADIVGRMARFAQGARATKLTDVPHEAFDVESGDNLTRLLKGQFALLGDEATEMEFFRRLADKELLQFKMRGTEDAGKGPIVIAIDKSGSMHGTPFHWAMGVAEAMRRFAADDGRDFHAMFFGNNNDRNHFDFPKGQATWEKIEAFLSVRADGGTQFDGVLTEALLKAQNAFDGDAKGKADVVFISDGQAHLTDEWIENFNAERNRVGVRVWSIYIGGAYDMGSRNGPQELMSRFSDAVVTVKDLNPEAAKKVFQSV